MRNPYLEVPNRLLRGGTLKEIYEMRRAGRSIRETARELGVSRNSVCKYLRSPGVPKKEPRRRRPSKLDPYTDHIDTRLSEGLDNCVVLLRELRAIGYSSGYMILKDYCSASPSPPAASSDSEVRDGSRRTGPRS